ncbi:probable flavin-containing monooxygenase 1 [Cryptomeria japonica]|uniref:probable flavin-containing monooxygenase 1 n=1 Tax=Cryptomeria japonica TaxID=3369 RepID=UPI0027DA10D3|nr:probable flavin-containing monooxygenase 1 [Cryptomeria japonica]
MESYRRGSLKEAESLTDYRQKKVGVIGAGVSGLLATKYLLSIGLKPTVFEAKEGLGGIWRQTFASTKTQTPRPAYQFTDFPWLSHVTTLLPNHNQVMDYFNSYANHFGLLDCILFNTTVVEIRYGGNESGASAGLWGKNGGPYDDGEVWEWYHFDFLVLSIGKYGGLPKIPSFPVNKGPEVFEGKVLHTMDYSAFNEKEAYETVKGKRVVIIGYQKSAMDFAVECAEANQGDNGPPCTMVFRRTHWMIPEDYLFWGVHLQYLYCTRFTQFLLGKPNQGFLLNLIAFLFSPLRWAINKFVELSELWRFPLKKYGLVPDMSFLEAITSCNIGSFPDKLFPKVEEGLIRFRKSSSWSFYNKGIVLDDGSKMEADVVVLGTGYDGDKKLKSLLPTKFGDVIEKSGGALSLYRGLIHPHIPQIAILGYSESLSNLHSSEIRSQWLAHFLSNKLVMPSVKEMEKNAKELEKYLEGIAGAFFWKTCHATFQITDNDDLCRDMGRNPMRKANWFDEIFSPYSNMDYGLEN